MNVQTSYGAQKANADVELPHNIEAEQQLLGALLINNDVMDRVEAVIKEEHFFDPLHARIFQTIASRIHRNALASPVTLKPFFEDDEGLRQVGGPAYLVRLAGAAISSFAARDYAEMIYDLAVRRELILLSEEITASAATMDVDTDPQDLIVSAEQSLYKLGEKGQAQTGFQSFLRSITDAVTSANAAYQRDGELSGLSTGLLDLDRKLGGLHRSDLIILAGRPSMGKTALAANMAFAVARTYRKGPLPDGTNGTVDGGCVGFFSLEMSAEQLATRLLADVSQVPSDRVRKGDMTEAEFRRFVMAAKELEACPLYIDDTPALPISSLANRARRLKRTQGLDALFVDYLQLVRATSKRDNRVNEVSEITQGLKAIAKELDIPVIALSQLSRQVEQREEKRPQLSDLRESGSIEQDADVVMFVFREEYYVEREKPAETDLEATVRYQEKLEAAAGKAEIIIGKQRHGPIGTVELAFEGAFTKFSNLVGQRQAGAYHVDQ